MQIDPPKDIQTTPERREQAIVAVRKITDGIAGMSAGWRLLAEGCSEVLTHHLYLEMGYSNYKDFFLSHSIDPQDAIHYATALRMFGNSPLARLPFSRLKKLLYLPAEAVKEIESHGVDDYLRLKRREFDRKVEELKKKHGGGRESPDDLFVRLRQKHERESRNHTSYADGVINYERMEQELSAKYVMYAAAVAALADAIDKYYYIVPPGDDTTIELTHKIMEHLMNPQQHLQAAARHLQLFCEMIEAEENTERESPQYLDRFKRAIDECRSVIARYDAMYRKSHMAQEKGRSDNIVPFGITRRHTH